ncbi:MAG: ATP-binding protein, partial [Actinomycetes bacterium]
LFGRCDEGLAVPYQPFVEALSHYVHHAPPAELPSGLGHRAGELARLVPELSELVAGLPSPPRCDPETERYHLFEAIASWLSAASADEVLLVILDDLHWATQPTLLALRHLLKDPSPARLLIVGSYRHTELNPAHSLADLLADLRRVPRVKRLTLGGLDEAEVTAFLEATGHPRSEHTRGLARTIRTQTDGNPFFVGELARHAAEPGALDRADDGGLAHLSIPEGVHEVMLRRLGRLSEAAKAALVTAAVVGVEFDLAVVAVVTGLSEEAVADAVEEAIAAGLVTEVASIALRCRFRHQLLRASLYGSLSIARRQHLHRRVGEAVERRALHPELALFAGPQQAGYATTLS